MLDQLYRRLTRVLELGIFSPKERVAEITALMEQTQNGSEANAVYLLELATVYLTSGAMDKADEVLTAADFLLADHGRGRLYYLGLKRFMHFRHRTYGLNETGCNYFEVSVHYDESALIQQDYARWNPVLETVTGDDQFMAGIWHNTLPEFLTLSQMGKSGQVDTAYDQQARVLIESTITNWNKTMETCAAYGYFGIAAFYARLVAHLTQITAGVAAGQAVANQSADYAQQAGLPSAAFAAYMLHDDLAAAALGGRLSWGMYILGGQGTDSSIQYYTEAKETRILESLKAEATFYGYQRAQELAHAQGKTDWIAWIALRLVGRHVFLGQEDTVLQQSKELKSYFTGIDHSEYVQVATTYQMALLYMQGLRPSELEARELAQLAEKQCGRSFALSLGNFLNRVARHIYLRKRQTEDALALYAFNTEFHRALGAEVSGAQNQIDMSAIYKLVGQKQQENYYLRKGLEAFSTLQNAYAKLPDWSNLKGTLLQHRIQLAAQYFNQATALQNADDLEYYGQQLLDMTAVFPPDISSDHPVAMNWSANQMLVARMKAQMQITAPIYRSRQFRKQLNEGAAQQQLQLANSRLGSISLPTRYMMAALIAREERNWELARRHYQQYHFQTFPNQDSTGMEGQLGNIFGMQEQIAKMFVNKEMQRNRIFNRSQALAMWVRLRGYTEANEQLDILNRLDANWWMADSSPSDCLADAALTRWKGGQTAVALQYCEKAIQWLEAARSQMTADELKTTFGGKGAAVPYELAATIYFDQGDPETAFSYAEKGRARALTDLLNQGMSQFTTGHKESTQLQQWRAANAEVEMLLAMLQLARKRETPNQGEAEDLETQLSKAQARQTQLDQQLRATHPGLFESLKGRDEAANISAIAAKLHLGQLLVNYLLQPQELLIWLINTDGLVYSTQVKVDDIEIEQQVDRHFAYCRSPKTVDTGHGSWLSKHLLSPIESYIEAAEQLFLVPHQSLHQLSFGSLPWKHSHLGLHKEIHYLPAAAVLIYLADSNWTKPGRVLAIGNPGGDLPHAGAEAQYVAELLSGKALVGTAASEAAVTELLPRADILHLATHGHLKEEAPLSSSLALANDEALSLYELMGLRLRARLVVLSACDSGRGQATGGNEVVGLTRGLLAAGAGSALASLWPVDDRATALLMAAFYDAIAAGAAPVQALRLAQLHLHSLSREQATEEWTVIFGKSKNENSHLRSGRDEMTSYALSKDYSHPFYWAAFNLVGR